MIAAASPTRPARPLPPCGRTLAERASFAVATYRAAGSAHVDAVTLRGRAIEACCEAAYAGTAAARERWMAEGMRLRKEAEEAWK